MPLTWFSHSKWNIGLLVEQPLRAIPPSEMFNKTSQSVCQVVCSLWRTVGQSVTYLCYIGQNRSCIQAREVLRTFAFWVLLSRNNTTVLSSGYLNRTGAGIVFINCRPGFLMKGIRCLIEG